MTPRRRRLGSILFVIALLAAGCSSASAGSPADTVKEVFRRVEAGQFDKVSELACTASKEKTAKAFDFAGALAANLPEGMDPAQVAAAVKVTTSGLVITEVSHTDKDAVVSVKGTLKMIIDPEKFKPILKAFLEAAGQPVDDAALSLAMTQMSSFLTNEQPIDTTADVILEGGAWKICE